MVEVAPPARLQNPDLPPDSSESSGESSATSIYSRRFWFVFAATFALNSANNLFVLFPLYIVGMGGGARTIGTIVATGSLAALIVRPAVGAVIDRFGRRTTALWAVILDAGVVMLYLPLHALGWAIYAVRALHGALDGTARVALFALVYEVMPEQRQGEAMATFSLSGMIPGAFGAVLGEFVMRRFGFSAFFCSAAALCLIAAGTLMRMRRGRAPRDTVAVTPSAGLEGAAGYRALLLDRRLLRLWLVTLFFGIAISSRNSFVAPYAYQRGIRSVGWYFTIYSLVAVFVRLSGRLMDRIGLERLVPPALMTLALGLALIAATGHYGMIEIAAAIGGLGHGFAYPAISALVIKNTHAGGRGRASSIYTSVWDASAIVGPYMLGMTAHRLGYGPMFVVSGMLSLAAALCMVVRAPRGLRA